MGHPTGIDLRALLRAGDLAQEHLMPCPPTIDSVSLMSGLAGVFSGFKLPVLSAAAAAGVDPMDVFVELGRRQAVAGPGRPDPGGHTDRDGGVVKRSCPGTDSGTPAAVIFIPRQETPR
jgi:DmpG-like communication domain